MPTYKDSLRPWLESDEPNAAGEIGMHCPLKKHEGDAKRSASVNFGKGVYNCMKCGGGQIEDLVDYLADNPDIKPGATNGHKNNGSNRDNEPPDEINEAQVAGWKAALFAVEGKLDDLIDQRGLSIPTIQKYELGWHRTIGGLGAYTIPVRGTTGELANVRYYQLQRTTSNRSKIWGVSGRNAPVLYPGQNLSHLGHTVIICEGELDALLTMQNGFDAVTRTGGANVWRSEWNSWFQGKYVYLCGDMDTAGQEGNRNIAAHLENIAAEVYCVQLPYPLTEKQGKDLTDYWLDDHTDQEFRQLLYFSEPWSKLDESEVRTVDASVLDSFDSSNVGSNLRMQVTITGKQNAAFLLPHVVEYRCDQKAGAKCGTCPMNSGGYDGKHSMTIASTDPILLKMMGATDVQVLELLRSQAIPHKCNRLEAQPTQQRSVEELFIRPSVDQVLNSTDRGDYTQRKIVSVGTHDTMANNTVQVIGSIYPSPRSQHNEFQAWDLQRTETSIDKFEYSPETHKLLRQFQPRRLQSPLGKLLGIANDLGEHVTAITKRPELHAMMDLAYHSVLGYTFDEQYELKGWLDVCVVGDTRTGKTEAAKKLIGWYAAGEYVSGEAASFAGVVGGLQQFGNRDWVVTWGAIPINDRRLVVLDEVTGLSTDQISQMSSIRSSGEAQLTKIQSQRTAARTRLIWTANPRDGKKVSEFVYGVQALKPLIGAMEDIARFDLAMSMNENDVPPEEINRSRPLGNTKYSQEAYRMLLHWAWTRKPEHIKWGKDVSKFAYQQANKMGNRYMPNPPLVQGANVRQKIVRVAVALATRLYSTEDGQHVLVGKEHIADAVKFMDRIYQMEGFGYATLSNRMVRDHEIAVASIPMAREYLQNNLPLTEALLERGGEFQGSTLYEVLDIPREEANAIISQLFGWKMIQRGDKGMNKAIPELTQVVKEVLEA